MLPNGRKNPKRNVNPRTINI